MKPSSLILTEATKATGLGHFTRCTALAEILAAGDNTVTIAVISDGLALPAVDQNIQIRFCDWRSSQKYRDLKSGENTASVFIDSYLTGAETYARWAQDSARLICIDDDNRIIYPESATIVNPGLGGIFVDYRNQAAAVMTGADYVLLRKAFRAVQNPPPLKQTIQSIMITAGSDDRWNIVPKILRFLTEEFPDLDKNVVIGPGFMNAAAIEKNADANTRFYYGPGAEQMCALMLHADVAITAGGQTTNELVRCGTPMIVVKVAENQNANIRGLINERIIEKYCETLEDVQAFVSSEMKNLAALEYRQQRRFRNLESFGNGIGFKRLVAEHASPV